jgi:hypothetical protein
LNLALSLGFLWVFDFANHFLGLVEGRCRVREKQTVKERERGVIGRLRERYRVREKQTVRERGRCYREIYREREREVL